MKANAEWIVSIVQHLLGEVKSSYYFIGASEYFKRTENIAGVKVGYLHTIAWVKPLTSAGHAVSSFNARCIV